MSSTLIRRLHLYLALFLAPWVLMYALSTLVMNHRAGIHGRPAAPWTKERELTYEGSFPPNAGLRDLSRQLLDAVDLDGAHSVNKRPDGTLVIARNDLLVPRRVTYTPATRQLVVERTELRPAAALERFHRRRGYETGYLLDTLWALSVDVVIVALVFWALSGLWLWWELKATRLLGALGGLAGVAGFAAYVALN